eukprot:GHVT01082817.1.p2 GENE.GHVT01082817.1~~GHVT01082817.1.p2  ORF type:complete len:181 (-),score=27.69 GHVT01082817.1:1148-1690(-)
MMLNAKFQFVLMALVGLSAFQVAAARMSFGVSLPEGFPQLSPAATRMACAVMKVETTLLGSTEPMSSALVLRKQMLTNVGGRRLADMVKVRMLLKNIGLTVATVGAVILAILHLLSLGNHHNSLHNWMSATFFTGFSLWAISKTLSKWTAIFKPVCKNVGKDEGQVDQDNNQDMAGKQNE